MRLFLPLLSIGCSSALTRASSTAPSLPSTQTDDGTTDPALADTASTSDAPPPVVYWSLHGSLDVVDAEVEITTSGIEIRGWTEALDDRCSVVLPLEGAAAQPSPPTAATLWGWWRLSHGEARPEDPSCPTWPSGSLQVGIGAYDARLDPAMDAAGWLGTDLYSLYLSTEGTTVYVVGVAGTPALFVGNDQTVTAAPLPDALYDIESLVVLELP